MTESINKKGDRSLRSRYDALRREMPNIRVYDAAARLDCSEMELLVLGLGEDATLLGVSDWEAFFSVLNPDTRFMSLVRNSAAVHEWTTSLQENRYRQSRTEFMIEGSYRFTLLNSVRLSVFSVVHEGGRMPPRSLQVFDEYGRAVWKLYVKSRLKEFDQAVMEFTAAVQSSRKVDVLGDMIAPPVLNTEKYGKVALTSYRTLLEQAVKNQWPITVTVENSTCAQAYSGPIGKTAPMDEWFNILDAKFNLHLRESLISSAWSAPDIRNRLAVSCLNSNNQPVLTVSLAADVDADTTDNWHKLIYEELSK